MSFVTLYTTGKCDGAVTMVTMSVMRLRGRKFVVSKQKIYIRISLMCILHMVFILLSRVDVRRDVRRGRFKTKCVVNVVQII